MERTIERDKVLGGRGRLVPLGGTDELWSPPYCLGQSFRVRQRRPELETRPVGRILQTHRRVPTSRPPSPNTETYYYPPEASASPTLSASSATATGRPNNRRLMLCMSHTDTHTDRELHLYVNVFTYRYMVRTR